MKYKIGMERKNNPRKFIQFGYAFSPKIKPFPRTSPLHLRPGNINFMLQQFQLAPVLPKALQTARNRFHQIADYLLCNH